jgi:photosystem II stability/assembly factor-like uncharacterized protein
MKKLITLAIITLSIIQVYTQNEPWIRISPKPIESSLKEITQIPGTDRKIAIGSCASIVITDDMGENWTVSYKPAAVSRIIHFNAIHFPNTNIGYIGGSKSTIVKTMDGGVSWVDISPSGDESIKDIYFINDNTGFYTKHNSIYKTENGGQTWYSVLADSTLIAPQDIHFFNDSVGYCRNLSSGYYFKTFDGGENWMHFEIFPGTDIFSINDIYFISDSIGFISGNDSYGGNRYEYFFRTVDGGTSWTEVYSPSLSWYNNFYFHNPDTGFAIGETWYHNLILKTFDGGDNWLECAVPYTWWSMNDMIFSDEGTGLCVGDHGQILKSTDWGNNWLTSDQHQVAIRNILDTEIIDDSTIFIGGSVQHNGQGRIYKSDDKGESWKQVADRYHEISSICFPSSEIGYACGPHSLGTLLKSQDEGNTWFEINVQNWEFKPTVVHFFNNEVGLVGGEGDDIGCYKTIDGGIIWSEASAGFPINWVIDFAFVNDTVGWALLDDCGIFKTTDQGETWEIYEDLGYLSYHKMKFISESVGFAVGMTVIFKTIDGGTTWYEVDPDILQYADYTDIDFPTPNIGYVTYENYETTLLKTNDGGENWFMIDFPCTATATRVDFFNEDEGLVMANSATIFKTYTGGVVSTTEFPAFDNSKQLLCYPVPAYDFINIEICNKENIYPAEASIYSVTGTKVISINIQPQLEIIQLDISGLENGVYIIATITNGIISKTGKFVKLD